MHIGEGQAHKMIEEVISLALHLVKVELPPLEVREAKVREFLRWWDSRPKSETDGSTGVVEHVWEDGVEYVYTSGRTRKLGRADEYLGYTLPNPAENAMTG